MGFLENLGKRMSGEARAVRALNKAVERKSPNAARAVAGNVLSSTLGGGLLGGAGNAALYANNQQGIGGSFSMGDAFMTGAVGGALLGGAIGIGGAKRVVATAKANRKTDQGAVKKAADRLASRYNMGPNAQVLRDAVDGKDEATIRQLKMGFRQSATEQFGLSKKAAKAYQTSLFSQALNGKTSA